MAVRDQQRKKFWGCAEEALSVASSELQNKRERDAFVTRITETTFVQNGTADIEPLTFEVRRTRFTKTIFVRTVTRMHTYPDRTREWVGYPTHVVTRVGGGRVTERDLIIGYAYALSRRHKLWRGTPMAWHGWQFCNAICEIVAGVYGAEAVRHTRSVFTANNVRCAAPKPPRVVPLKQRSELSERLEHASPKPNLSSVALLDKDGSFVAWVATSGLSRVSCMTTTNPSHAKVWATERGAENYLRQPAMAGLRARRVDAPPLQLAAEPTTPAEEVVWSLSPDRQRTGNEDVASLGEERLWAVLGVNSPNTRWPIKEQFGGDPVDELERTLAVCNAQRITPSFYRAISYECCLTARELDRVFRYGLCRVPRDYNKISPSVSAALNRLNAQKTRREILTDAMFAGAGVFAALTTTIGFDDWTSRSLLAALIGRPTTNHTIPHETILHAPRGVHRTPVLRKACSAALTDGYFPAPEVRASETEYIIESWSHPTPLPVYAPVATTTQSGHKPVYGLWLPPVDDNHPTAVVVQAWEHKHRLGLSWVDAIDAAYQEMLDPHAA